MQAWNNQNEGWPEGWSLILEALCCVRSSPLVFYSLERWLYHIVQTYFSILTTCLILLTFLDECQLHLCYIFCFFRNLQGLISYHLQVFAQMLPSLRVLFQARYFKLYPYTPYLTPRLSIFLCNLLPSDIQIYFLLIDLIIYNRI